MPSIRGRFLYGACAAFVVACAFGGFAWYRAGRAVREAETVVERAGEFAFARSRLGERAPAFVEYIPGPPGFRDACAFRGRLYIGGAAGLLAVDELGRETSLWRTGEILPAPVTAVEATATELWIATAGAGLLRFDGAHFEQIVPEPAALRTITALVTTSNGRVLFGTSGRGVLAFDGERITTVHSELGRGRVNALAGNDTDLWVATADRGLLHLHAGQVDTITARDGLPDGQALSVAADGDRAWAGTAIGVAEFAGGRFERVVGEGLFAQAVTRSKDDLLVGTIENGAYRVPLTARKPSSYPAALAGSVEKIAQWAGRDWAVQPDNLYDLRTAEPLLPRNHTTLSDRNVSALAVDARGRVWVGYFDRGLDVVEPGFASARHIEDERLFCVNRVVLDASRGLVAVATANGLLLLDGEARVKQALGRNAGLLSNHVTDVAPVPGGLIAATPAGVTWLDADGARSMYAFHGLINNHVYSVAATQGRVVAGTLGGLSVIDAGLLKANYSISNSPLRQNWITAVLAIGRDFFIGTYGAGVAKFTERGTWEAFADMPNVEINPNAMAASRDRVYAGSLGHGLWVFSAAQNRWHAVTRGLPSSNVTAVATAGGYLYAGTDNGLVRIPEDAL